MKKMLTAIVPEPLMAWRRRIRRKWADFKLRRALKSRVASAYAYDSERFMTYSAACLPLQVKAGQSYNKDQFRAILTIEYHRLEKGLSVPEPRPGFGARVAEQLCGLVDHYISLFGYSEICELCVVALDHHNEFNAARGFSSPKVTDWLMRIRADHPRSELSCNRSSATRVTSRQEIQTRAKVNLESFFHSRHSIRHFANAPVDDDEICRAVELASRSPSVCNRQTARVYVVRGSENCRRVLELQNGNKGFGHTLETVLIVTSDTQCFGSLEERNQCWIDGGLFAMSLVYALHAAGLGTCCLNWCVSAAGDQELHRIVGIHSSEAVIMMIAVGVIADHLEVAKSARLPLSQIIRYASQHL
jgi:nitroreductase